MASASIPVKQLDDITECPICKELYTDPRVLPCIHTYCFKCIEKWGRERIADGKLACPVCRKEMSITKKGLTDLPKNFFVGKLLEVRKLASALSLKEMMCDVCDENQGRKTPATVYCTECRKNMCPQCLGCHQTFRFPTPHKVVEVDKQQQVDELLSKLPENVCDKHPDKNIEFYCFDCKLVACVACCITGHCGHKCSDVKQVAQEMSGQVKTDTDGFGCKVAECKELLQQLEKERKEFVENVSKTEKEIVEKAEKAEELKQLIEDYKVKLLEELSSARKQQEKKVENVRQELEGRLLMMDSFKKYSDELRSKGTACDIVRAASSLHDRAVELMQFDVRKEFKAQYSVVDIKFTSQAAQTQTEAGEWKQLFGELVININKTMTTKEDDGRLYLYCLLIHIQRH